MNYILIERFTNPIMLNIPTIGNINYQSYQYYWNEFLCDNINCIKELITNIVENKKIKSFSKLKNNVQYHLDINNIKHQYNELFHNVMNCGIYQSSVDSNYLSYLPNSFIQKIFMTEGIRMFW